MSETLRIEPLPTATDLRGLVFEPLGPNDLPLQQNAHVVLTEPGCVRGNHFHRVGSEVSVVIGPALFRYRQDGQVLDFEVPAGKTYQFVIPPGLPHAFQNTGQGTMLLIGFNTVPHDPKNPDVVRDVLIPSE